MQLSPTLRRTLAKFNLATISTYIVAGSLAAGAPFFVNHVLAAPPTCNGLTATIYVDNTNHIVSTGPQNGQVYAGTLNGTNAADVMVGTTGDDTINGGNQADTICGLEGTDTLNGGLQNDWIDGGTGNDTIDGGLGNDTMIGGEGNDKLTGGNTSDSMDGGADTDFCSRGLLNLGSSTNCEAGFGEGVIVINVNADPDHAQDFSFSTTSGLLGTEMGSFQLDDDSDGTLLHSRQFNNRDVAIYTITEDVTSGWTLSGISCSGGATTVNMGSRRATIVLTQADIVSCTFTNTLDVACGNGVTQGVEECDDGNSIETDSCTTSCHLAACGDGFVQTGEQCDDENTSPSDGCSASCQIESSSSSSMSSMESSTSSEAPGLTIDKVAGDTAIAGMDFNYQISIASTSYQSGLQLTDMLPETMRFQALLAPAGWDCSVPTVGDTGTITCTKPEMAAAETADFTITTRTSACPQAEVTNHADIESLETLSQSDSVTHSVICAGSSSSAASSAGSSTSSFASSEVSSFASSSSFSSSSSSVVPVACVPSGLLAYWKGDEGETHTVVDSTGNGHTGMLENGADHTAPGTPAVTPNVGAYIFDGIDDQVRIDNAGMSHDTSDFSVSFFAKTTTGDRAVLGHFNNPGSGYRGWGAYFYATNRVNFFAYGDMGVNDNSFASPSLLSGGWHHVVGTFQRSGDSVTIRTYVDGVLIGTNTATVGNIGINTDMLLGKYTFQSNFEGQLDDVRVYGRTLGDTEVLLINSDCEGGSESSSSSSFSSFSSSSSSFSFSSFMSSSSSSFSGEETASSSSSVSSGPETFGFTAGTQGNGGGRRGARSNEIIGSAHFIAGNFGIRGTAPGAFGGGLQNKPTKAQRDYMCSVYLKYLGSEEADDALLNLIVEDLAATMGVSKVKVAKWFQDPELCAGLTSRMPTKTLSARPEVTILLTPEGYPVSSNAAYNAYIKAYYQGGTLDIATIRGSVKDASLATARTRIDGKISVSPGDYRIAGTNVWYYPDLSIYFTYDPNSKTTTLPAGYRGDRQVKVVSADQSL